MKKLLFSLSVVLLTTTFSFSQTTFPDSGKDFAVRGNFVDPFFSSTSGLTANWYSDNQNTMVKNTKNLYSFQLFLPASHDGGTTKYNYEYTTVFKNEGTVGPRDTNPRIFTLNTDKTVTFYAKTFEVKDASGNVTGYQTQTLCDAQYVTLQIMNNWAFPGFKEIFPLPVNGKSSLVVTLPAEFDLQYLVYVPWTYGRNISADLNDIGFPLNIYGRNTGGGRYKMMIDYPSVSSSFNKVLDSIGSPKIKVGLGTLVAPSDVSFAGANLGTFNNTTALKIGGSLNAYSLKKAVNVTDVVTKLYYQITKNGYDSGTKELELVTTGTTMLNATFTNATGLDVSTGLANGDYTLKVWYGATCLEDVLLLDNTGAGYSTSFSVNNTATAIESPTISAKILIENGNINASFDKSTSVKLFTISGQLINQIVATKNFSQAVQRGIYLLNVDGKSYKLIVK